jgi:hypothetical protein
VARLRQENAQLRQELAGYLRQIADNTKHPAPQAPSSQWLVATGGMRSARVR